MSLGKTWPTGHPRVQRGLGNAYRYGRGKGAKKNANYILDSGIPLP